MAKTILITGSTDGIGFETAKLLAAEGHHLLLHGRNKGKLEATARILGGQSEQFVADLASIQDVEMLARAIAAKHDHLDVLINNAGVYKAENTVTQDGLDLRFIVNTLAPYLLTKRLLPLMDGEGRVVNLSSAAQAPVNLSAMRGQTRLSDMEAYAQSKLAITMWSRHLAEQLPTGPSIIAVNPGSLLASKMVKEGFGVEGNDLAIGADILRRIALEDEFSQSSGKYFDNDAGQFGRPHPDALDQAKVHAVTELIEQILADILKAQH